jgi:hypothetical protein
MGRNPFITLRKISSAVKKKIGHVAIRNYFKSENISSFSPIKKPLLKPSHKIAKVEAAKNGLN